jgi:Ni/Fe-hydrogenase subunit HybB-like protein
MEKKASTSYWVYMGILIFITLIGVYALGVRLVEGLGISNINSIVTWGLWISFYIFFIGISAGAFLLSTLVYVFGFKKYEKTGKIAVFTALLALLAGLGFVSIDLGHIERFFYVFVSPSATSVLTWVIYFYTAYVVLLILELVFLLRKKTSPGRIEGDKKTIRILGIIGIPIALIVHGGTGAVFAVTKGQEYWFSGLFPLIFIISALASGGALIAALYAFLGKRDPNHASTTKGIAKIAAWFLIFDLALIFLEFLVTRYGGVPGGLKVLEAIVAGPNWWIFWIIQILIGVIIPLVLIFSPASRSPKWVGVAGILIVIGVIGVRWNIVVPQLSVPSFEGITEAVSDSRLTTNYIPSLIEWGSSLGILGIMTIIFSLGYRGLPLINSREKGGV